MTFLRSVNLSKRLALGFGLMLVLLAIVVVLSVTRLGQQAGATLAVTHDVYPKVEAAQTIAYSVMDIARVTRNLLLVTDKAQEAANQAAHDKDRATIEEKLAFLDQRMTSDSGRALLADLRAKAADYFAFTDDVMEVGRKDRKEAGTALLFGPRYQTQKAFIGALEELVRLEQANMVAASTTAAEAYRSAVTSVLIVAGVAALIGLFCAWFITQSITVPLRRAVAIARSVAAGDLSSSIPTGAHDEAGQLFEALKAMNDSLASIVGAVRQSSDSIATGSGEIAMGNADLSQRTEQQAANLQQTAASMEQMHSSVKQSAETARTATQLAASASAVALRGGEVVAQVVSTMDHISASSRKIADIVGVIDGIAFQTNILALNAAVEAARAGEQGRGFAVVASEVRSLAQRSAESAKQIKSLITESVETVESGSRLVGGAGTTMTDIVGQVRRVADLIGEMSASTEEQTKGIGQVSEAVGALDQVTQQNAALVEESAAAADSLKQQAIRMTELVSVFTLSGANERAGERAAARVTVAAPVKSVATPKPVPPKPAAAGARPRTTPASAPKTSVAAGAEQDWEAF